MQLIWLDLGCKLQAAFCDSSASFIFSACQISPSFVPVASCGPMLWSFNLVRNFFCILIKNIHVCVGQDEPRILYFMELLS